MQSLSFLRRARGLKLCNCDFRLFRHLYYFSCSKWIVPADCQIAVDSFRVEFVYQYHGWTMQFSKAIICPETISRPNFIKIGQQTNCQSSTFIISLAFHFLFSVSKFDFIFDSSFAVAQLTINHKSLLRILCVIIIFNVRNIVFSESN